MTTPSLWPEFYLLGAPKCGTTALYQTLAGHPAIHDAAIKEPAFFALDWPRARSVSEGAAYHANYARAAGVRAIDASTAYFYSAAAVPAILHERPDARFVIVLRNNADMVLSLHNQERVSLHEPEADFGTAWAQSDQRWQGGWKALQAFPHLVCYKEAGRLGHYTAQLKAQIPPGQLHIVLLDDLKADFRTSWLALLAFLGLDDDGQQAMEVANPAQERRWRTLYWLLLASYGPMGPVKRWIKRVAGINQTRLMKSVGTASLRPVSVKPTMPAELRAEIDAHFASDRALLEQVLQRDLSHWGRSAP